MIATIHTISTWDNKLAVLEILYRAEKMFTSKLLVTKEAARQYHVGDMIDVVTYLQEGVK